MSKIDTLERQINSLRKALSAKSSGVFNRILLVYGERTDSELRAEVEQFLKPAGMTLNDAANAGLVNEIKFVQLKWLEGRRINDLERNHQSVGPITIDHLLSKVSEDQAQQDHQRSPLLPPSPGGRSSDSESDARQQADRRAMPPMPPRGADGGGSMTGPAATPTASELNQVEQSLGTPSASAPSDAESRNQCPPGVDRQGEGGVGTGASPHTHEIPNSTRHQFELNLSQHPGANHESRPASPTDPD